MSMKKILLAGVAGTFIAGSAMAAEPVTLTDGQMDGVSAGALNLTLAFTSIGQFDAFNSSAIVGTVLNQTATSEQLVLTPGGTAVASLIETQAVAGVDVQQSSLLNGGTMFSEGMLAAAGQLGIVNFP